VLDLTVPATHAASRVARRIVSDFARLDGLPSEEVEQLALVVSELTGNAVDHGGGGAAMDSASLVGDVTMRLSLELTSHRWVVWVDDQGGGDVEELAAFLEPDAEIPLDDERGRGFFLLKAMVEDLRVEPSADGRGIRVRVERAFGEQ
jgi:anti-sigma regulatory factor (Ser/Thr protein kinase)